MAAELSANLIWACVWTSGRDPARHAIVGLATVVTDAALDVIAEGPSLLVCPADSALVDESMVDGDVLRAARASGCSPAEAERATLEVLARHTEPATAPLCGDGVWWRRRLLRQGMPSLHAHLHYRTVDLSTLEALASRWYALSPPPRAIAVSPGDELRATLERLRAMRRELFRPPAVLAS